ncbi:MAG: hypothetical protein ONB05_09835 [candidate division KSB1 bacterium]|nr:hypothetical protein [candidate division KSB1 bacterium]
MCSDGRSCWVCVWYWRADTLISAFKAIDDPMVLKALVGQAIKVESLGMFRKNIQKMIVAFK